MLVGRGSLALVSVYRGPDFLVESTALARTAMFLLSLLYPDRYSSNAAQRVRWTQTGLVTSALANRRSPQRTIQTGQSRLAQALRLLTRDKFCDRQERPRAVECRQKMMFTEHASETCAFGRRKIMVGSLAAGVTGLSRSFGGIVVPKPRLNHQQRRSAPPVSACVDSRCPTADSARFPWQRANPLRQVAGPARYRI